MNGNDYMKKKILIVDDDKNVTKSLKISMEKKYDILTLNDSMKAVSHAKYFEPDLMILDIMMPDISGGELAQEMKREKKLMDVPIIFLSGLINQSEEQELYDSQFLAKPVNFAKMLQLIESKVS